MSPLDPGPVSVGRIELEVDGQVLSGFSEVSGLALELDVLENRQTAADGSVVVRRLPGRWKSGEVTLTRGLTSDIGLNAWMVAQVAGAFEVERATSLVMYDASGTPVARYHLENAWPAKLEISSLKAGGTDVLVEQLVLVYESVERL